MNVNTPTAAPMAFFVPSHNAVYDRATQLDGQWVTQREAKTLESLRRLYPDAELIPATQVQEKQNDGYRLSFRGRSPLERQHALNAD
ncbi:TPA: hypothetical protein ACGPLO_004730 [Enterobacter hormaechei]